MRPFSVAVSLLALMAGPHVTGCGDPVGGGRCSMPDIDQPCTQGSTATKSPSGAWSATIRATRTTSEAYMDAGFVCSRSVTSCVILRTCVFPGAPATWTADDAIRACDP